MTIDRDKVARSLGSEFAELTKETAITDAMVARVMAKGVGWICAHCEHFWWGLSRGVPMCRIVFQKGQDACGGPIVGRTFPEYRGPLSRSIFPDRCFVCGDEATCGIQVRGSKELIGACEEHEQMVHEMRPHDAEKDKPPVPRVKAILEVPR